MTAAISGEITVDKLDDAATQGLIAMFDGTELTEDVFIKGWRKLDEQELSDALNKIINWYTSVKPHKTNETIGELPDDPVLSLYHSLLSSHLPSEIDKQDPQLLLDVMNAESSSAVSADDIPDDLKVYYGL